MSNSNQASSSAQSAPPAAFRKSFPLNFSLHDAHAQQVLYIINDPAGQDLSLEIHNTSSQDIVLAQMSGPASTTNHHFELRFRPGTLAASSLHQIRLAEGEWSLGRSDPAHVGGPVSLYFLCTSTEERRLKPGGLLKLTLRHISPDGSGGARGTRVELKYKNLQYGSTPPQTVPSSSRVRHLSIIKHQGQKYIPLHVGFVGSNQILNDGKSENTLTLRLTNTLRQGSIELSPGISYPPAPPTKLILSFDVSDTDTEEWALGTKGQVESVSVKTTWGTVRSPKQGESPEWIITPQARISLGPHQHVDVALSGIKSSLPCGPTNLYLRYENIQGHWDGQFVCVIEKGPIVYRGDEKWPLENKQVRVGIGTTDPDPQTKLDVAGRARFTGEARFDGTVGSSADLQMVSNVRIGTKEQGRKLHILNRNQPADAAGDTLILGPTDASHLRLGYNAEYSWIQSQGDKPLAINPIANNVGIGIDKPEAKLHVTGESRFGGVHVEGRTHFAGNVVVGTTERPASLTVKSSPAFKGRAQTYIDRLWGDFINLDVVKEGDPIQIGDRISTVARVERPNIIHVVPAISRKAHFGTADVSYAPSPFRVDDATGKPQLVVTSLGSVGIGRMPNPEAKLDVDGPIFVKGIDASRRDLAENYLSDIDLAPGDVVCLDPDHDLVVLSEKPDDLLVMGVISTEPGVLLNARHDGEKRKDGRLAYPVALRGRVPCKVVAENGCIRRGDLLTTSSTRGHAMKSLPVNLCGIEIHRPGTIIGKALEAHRTGKGVIEILITGS